MNVALFFALGTAVELSLLVYAGSYISTVNMFSIIMVTFLVGVIVGRQWTKEWFEKIQWHLKSGTMPVDDVLNGTVLAISSLLLITPGIITDVLGILIMIPMTRAFFKDMALSLVKRKISHGELYFFFKD
ncbi:MAG: FxsA family protein [Nitrospinales bacterium]